MYENKGRQKRMEKNGKEAGRFFKTRDDTERPTPFKRGKVNEV